MRFVARGKMAVRGSGRGGVSQSEGGEAPGHQILRRGASSGKRGGGGKAKRGADDHKGRPFEERRTEGVGRQAQVVGATRRRAGCR